MRCFDSPHPAESPSLGVADAGKDRLLRTGGQAMTDLRTYLDRWQWAAIHRSTGWCHVGRTKSDAWSEAIRVVHGVASPGTLARRRFMTEMRRDGWYVERVCTFTPSSLVEWKNNFIGSREERVEGKP